LHLSARSDQRPCGAATEASRISSVRDSGRTWCLAQSRPAGRTRAPRWFGEAAHVQL